MKTTFVCLPEQRSSQISIYQHAIITYVNKYMNNYACYASGANLNDSTDGNKI